MIRAALAGLAAALIVCLPQAAARPLPQVKVSLDGGWNAETAIAVSPANPRVLPASS